LGTTVTNQNYVNEEMKNTLNLGNASCYLVQNFLSSHFLSRNVNVILPVVLCGYESWYSLKERTLRVFENEVLRRIFDKGKSIGKVVLVLD
jgi:hypothetical protein